MSDFVERTALEPETLGGVEPDALDGEVGVNGYEEYDVDVASEGLGAVPAADGGALAARISVAGFQVSQAAAGLEQAAGLLRTVEELAGDAEKRVSAAELRRADAEEQSHELAQMLEIAQSQQAELETRSQAAQERAIVAEQRANVAEEQARAAAERLQQVLERTFALEAQLGDLTIGRLAEPKPDVTLIVDDHRDELRDAIAAEIRRPLSSIHGLTLALKHADAGSSDGKSMIRQLGASARRLERLVDQMIELDSIANGTFVPNRRRADLKAIVRRVVEETSDIANRDVRVHAEHVTIEIDPALTEQMVESLLTNAAKRTAPGNPVWVLVSSDPEGAVIAVDDTCPEIPTDMPGARAASRSDRGPAARRKTSRGATGLALLSRLAELHGGKAWVEERPGGGASFRVFLPNASKEPHEDATVARATAPQRDDDEDVDMADSIADGRRELSSFDDLSDEVAI